MALSRSYFVYCGFGLASLACDPLRPVATEICANGLDDNQNGAIDCAEPNCASLPICTENNPSQPRLPEWWDEDEPNLDEDQESESWCHEVPPEDPPLGRYGCSLEDDDCDVGERCIVLTQELYFQDTVCVPQGCENVGSSCSAGILADECPSGTLCLGIEQKCENLPCCVDLCDRRHPHCSDCIPLSTFYSGTDVILPNIGVCRN